MIDRGVKEGYMALAVALWANCLTELAFDRMVGVGLNKCRRVIDEMDIKLAKQLREEGTTIRELAETFCWSVPTVSRLTDPETWNNRPSIKRGR